MIDWCTRIKNKIQENIRERDRKQARNEKARGEPTLCHDETATGNLNYKMIPLNDRMIHRDHKQNVRKHQEKETENKWDSRKKERTGSLYYFAIKQPLGNMNYKMIPLNDKLMCLDQEQNRRKHQEQRWTVMETVSGTGITERSPEMIDLRDQNKITWLRMKCSRGTRGEKSRDTGTEI